MWEADFGFPLLARLILCLVSSDLVPTPLKEFEQLKQYILVYLDLKSLPANSFDIAGRSLTLLVAGNFANNTNAKTAKIIVGATTAVVGSAVSGGTTLATTGVYNTTGAVGWALTANVNKYGAAGTGYFISGGGASGSHTGACSDTSVINLLKAESS